MGIVCCLDVSGKSTYLCVVNAQGGSDGAVFELDLGVPLSIQSTGTPPLAHPASGHPDNPTTTVPS